MVLDDPCVNITLNKFSPLFLKISQRYVSGWIYQLGSFIRHSFVYSCLTDLRESQSLSLTVFACRKEKRSISTELHDVVHGTANGGLILSKKNNKLAILTQRLVRFVRLCFETQRLHFSVTFAYGINFHLLSTAFICVTFA